LDGIVGLYLHSNNLVGELPIEISELAYLEQFWFYRNRGITSLGQLPTKFHMLANLKEFLVSGNHMDDRIPDSIGNLTSATILWLGGNNWYGSIPSSVGKLNKLEELYTVFGFSLT
jgi:Leucine-rich repeat (LRR) protein